jgi:hypothetical protein
MDSLQTPAKGKAEEIDLIHIRALRDTCSQGQTDRTVMDGMYS